MIFNDIISELTPSMNNHASVFNAVNNQLLENTKFNKQKIDFYLDDVPMNIFTSEFVLGTISSTDGQDVESLDAIRTKDYVSVEPLQTYYVENDLNYKIYVYAYKNDHTFISQIGKFDNKCVFETPDECAYLKFRTSTSNIENNINVKFEMYKGMNRGGKVHIGQQDLISLIGDYELLIDYIDDNIDLPITTLRRKAKSGEYTILEIEAPRENPKESTITLMRTNLPTGGAEFIDFTDMNYGKRKCCLVVQKRGSGAKLAPFDIAFNDGEGRVDKFSVFPDEMPVELRQNGIVLNGDLVPNQYQLAKLEDKFNRTFSSEDGTNITVYSSKQRQISNGLIKGRSNNVFKLNNEQVQFTNSNRRKSFNQVTLQPGKQYTIIANCIAADAFPKSLIFYTPDVNETSVAFDFEKTGLKKHTFTVDSQTTIGIMFGSYSQFSTETNYLDFKQVVLLEGDYSGITDEDAQLLIESSSGQIGSSKAIVTVNGVSYKVYSDTNKQQIVELRDDDNFYDEIQYLSDGTAKISTTDKSTQQITTKIIPASQVEVPNLNEGKNTISVGGGCLSKMFTFEVAGDINNLLKQFEINLPMSQANETIAIKIKNSIAQGQLCGRYRYTSGHSSDAPIAKHGIISYKKTKESIGTDIVFHSDGGEVYTSVINGNTGQYISNWSKVATDSEINVLSEYKNMGSTSASNPSSNYKTGLFNVGTPVDGKYFYVTKIKYPDLGDGYYKLIAYGFDASDDKTKDSIWTGRIHAGQFTGWIEQATTQKTDILCTPSSGYKITSQSSCVINNIVYLSITIEKSDGGIIPQTALVAIVPSLYKPNNGLKSADAVTLAGTSVNGVASCLISTTGNIQYIGTATNTTKLLINAQYVI